MKKTILLLILLLNINSYSRIFIMGDSTASNYSKTRYPLTGWGMKLPQYMDLEVLNFAVSGASTKSFQTLGYWEEVYNRIEKGDYVLIQFGHNDKSKDPKKNTNPFKEYSDNLILFIEGIREKEATPVLLTPIQRRIYVDMKIKKTHGKYPDAMRIVAKDLSVPLIDMSEKSLNMLNNCLGEESSKKYYLNLEPGEYKNYPNGLTDNTHLTEKGANIYAQLIARELKKLGIN